MYGMTLTIANQTFNKHFILFYKSGDQYIAVRGGQKFSANKLSLLIDLMLTLFMSKSTDSVSLTAAQLEAGLSCWHFVPELLVERSDVAIPD